MKMQNIKLLFSTSIIFIYCCNFSTHAADNTQYASLLRQASVYEEAGMSEEAIALYQDLLKGELTSDQQNVLLYDIGTLYLKRQEFDKAIEQFSSIHSDEVTFPLLASRLNRNLGISYYSKALQIIQAQPKNLEEMKEVLYDLRSALASFNKESKAHCDMQHLTDQQLCLPAEELLHLQNDVKIEIAALQAKVVDLGAAELPLEEEIPWLYDSVNALQMDIDFIEESTLETSQKNLYLRQFVLEQPSWTPLWDSSGNMIQQLNKSDNVLEANNLFTEARKNYNSGLQNLKIDQLNSAKEAFTASKHYLTELMKVLYEQDPLRLNLYRLLGMYKRLAQNTTFTESQLDNIKDAYAQLNSSVSPAFKEVLKERSSIEKAIMLSQQHLDASLNSLLAHQHASAYIYMLSAMGEVQDAIFDLKKASPEGLIERSLFLQNFALKLNGRLIQYPSEAPTPDLLKLPIEAQKKTLQAADAFWKAVKEQQNHQFHKEGLCQSSPWGTTLPLFEKGNVQAKEAMSLLSNANSDEAKALTAQMNAVEVWEETLKEIRNPHEDPRSGCHQGTSGAEESDQKAEAPQNKLLQTLQQMFLDDKAPNKDQPAVKLGDKPW